MTPRKPYIAFLWIIHISALVGIALGYAQFFLPKTPLNMLYILLGMVFFYPLASSRSLGVFTLAFVVGMSVEWIGVHTGLLFGDYTYGQNFGPKLDGIPYLIGINWAVLTLACGTIATKTIGKGLAAATAAAGLMVLLDFFLEQICSWSGYWTFSGGGAGWLNYVCWFVIAFLLQLAFQKITPKGNRLISLHIYGTQLFYASALWLLITI